MAKPYVKTNKHDMADAEAICKAVSRPNMRFVSIKNIEQQAILSVHRARQGLVKAKTAQANQVRGLLAEFGTVIPQGIHSIVKRIPGILEDVVLHKFVAVCVFLASNKANDNFFKLQGLISIGFYSDNPLYQCFLRIFSFILDMPIFIGLRG